MAQHRISSADEFLAAIAKKLNNAGESTPKKDAWDKLAAVTTLISSVVIGAAGVSATYNYNNKELEIKHIEKEQEEQRLKAQANATMQIELSKRLETLFPYLSATETNKRAFGYEMFSALGQGELALKLIKVNKDTAGAAVVQNLLVSANPETVRQASAVDSALRLREWLFPKGALNAANFKSLQDWIYKNTNNVGMPVAEFVVADDPKIERLREKAISEFKVPVAISHVICGTSTVQHVPKEATNILVERFRADGAVTTKIAPEETATTVSVIAEFPPCP